MQSNHKNKLFRLIGGTWLIAALTLPSIVFGFEGMQNTPNVDSKMGPVTIPDMTLPFDCKAIDDELAQIDKFSHNPKATKTQLKANATRSEKLRAKQLKLKCPGD